MGRSKPYSHGIVYGSIQVIALKIDMVLSLVINTISYHDRYPYPVFSLGQYPAMECLRNHVHKKYHRLLLNGLPNLKILLGQNTSTESKDLDSNLPSLKILNGPAVSRDSNETDIDTVNQMKQFEF